MNILEKEHKIKVKYPKLRGILKKLYKEAFNSGATQNSGDSYDYSSAYKETEQFIQEEVGKMCEEMESEIKKSFPRGERKWCVECGKRITKEIKSIAKKYGF